MKAVHGFPMIVLALGLVASMTPTAAAGESYLQVGTSAACATIPYLPPGMPHIDEGDCEHDPWRLAVGILAPQYGATYSAVCPPGTEACPLPSPDSETILDPDWDPMSDLQWVPVFSPAIERICDEGLVDCGDEPLLCERRPQFCPA